MFRPERFQAHMLGDVVDIRFGENVDDVLLLIRHKEHAEGIPVLPL